MTYPFVRSAVDLGRARGPRLAFVVHMAEGGGTVGYLSRQNPNGVSVHFVIERSGRTVQMLELSHMHSSIRANAIRTTSDPDGFYGATAAKAVMGDWARPGKTLGPNHASIALEIEGFAKDGPNAAQTAALKALYADLAKRYPGIRSLGHRDFASYKACPGKRIPWSLIGGHGTSKPGQPAPQPATPAKEEPVATDPNIRLLDAVIDRAEYAKNEIKAQTPNDAVGHLAKINEFAGRVLVSIVGAPAIVSAAATVDDSGDLFSWSDARAGNIDLGSSHQDVYGGFQQWVAVRLGWAKAPSGSVFERGDQDDARQKAVVILGLGERYFPLDVYPVIPDDVLEAVFGTSEPAGIRAAIASYRAQQPGGAGIVDRPETA